MVANEKVQTLGVQLLNTMRNCKRLCVCAADDNEMSWYVQGNFDTIVLNGQRLWTSAQQITRTPFTVPDDADGVVVVSCVVNAGNDDVRLREVHDIWRNKLHIKQHVPCVELHMRTDEAVAVGVYGDVTTNILSPEVIATAKAKGINVDYA